MEQVCGSCTLSLQVGSPFLQEALLQCGPTASCPCTSVPAPWTRSFLSLRGARAPGVTSWLCRGSSSRPLLAWMQSASDQPGHPHMCS
eukprot:8998730-Prorocentrum_lima.AAC.1